MTAAWIESHQELREHPKLYELMALLGVDKTTAIGHLHLLWYWAIDYAPDGVLHYNDSQIAIACNWKGDPEKFVQALLTARFLERTSDGIAIHDWLDYCGSLMEKRLERARKRSHHGSQADAKREPNGSRTDAGREPTNQPTVPNQQNQPNRLAAFGDIRNFDFKLRLTEEQMAEWVKGIRDIINKVNEKRQLNKFVWTHMLGSFEGDLSYLMYHMGDDDKLNILYEAVNQLSGKFNWPDYLELAIRYMLVISEKSTIQYPLKFILASIKVPAKMSGIQMHGLVDDLARRKQM